MDTRYVPRKFAHLIYITKEGHGNKIGAEPICPFDLYY